MTYWVPIATAPQDGMTKIVAGAWSEDGSKSTITVTVLEPAGSTQGDVTKPRSIHGMGMIFYPTHWLPLPAPPSRT